MRKIERQMIAAIRAKKAWKSGNTEVVVIPLGDLPLIEVRLHGNKIAEFLLRHDTLNMTLAGWPTVTTRSRLNALVREFTSHGGFYQRDHEQYFAGTGACIGSHELVTVPLCGSFNRDVRDAKAAEWARTVAEADKADKLFPHRADLQGAPMELG